ncbi:MAG: putative quinol monooxygenase [Bryobacteraceae bacterium]
MSQNLLTVVAEIQAKRGKEDDLRQVLLGLIGPTRQEGGCVQYDLHEDNEAPGRFLFYENWQSREHLNQHAESPHLRAFKARFEDLLEGPIRLLLMTRIG